MQPIEVKIRNIYGIDRLEICGPLQAIAFSELTGRKTVTEKDIKYLKVLGLEVIILDEVLGLGKFKPRENPYESKSDFRP